ncbi:MAG: alpha-E domain-containing protein [Proteobacteria bacterium]|nr:alpha-E domain-containing protein [Pseudomonadota bacterium]
MLGRTASGLFWLFRYLERMENTARLINAAQWMSLTRMNASDSDWLSVLNTVGAADVFTAQHKEVTKANVIDWLLRSSDYPSSLINCMNAVQFNGKSVRTAITEEVWEAINAGHIDLNAQLKTRVSESSLNALLSDVRDIVSLIQGMAHSTMLRNEIFQFMSIGTHIERTDCTLRLLDVKYYVLLPSVSPVGSVLDNVQWETILRSVSSLGGMKMTYGEQFSAPEIIDYLVLNGKMPRSLSYCLMKVSNSLRKLSIPGRRNTDSMMQAKHLADYYLSVPVDSIFEYGLHEFLQKLLVLNSELSDQIAKDYRFYE